MPAIVAGEVQFAFDTMTTSLPQARSGTVIPLAVSSKERAKSAPDIAPVGETIPGFDVMAWNGLVAPPGTPRPIIDKLNKALVEIMASPDIVAKFEQLGTIPASSSPDEFAKFIADEVKKFKEVAEAANIKAE
jgi:tripartite-type tricarboxylate transporter receptor subunit TctC